MTTAHLNRIATAVPAHDVHQAFVASASAMLGDARKVAVFQRMVSRAQIDHRYSCLAPSPDTHQPGAHRVDTHRVDAEGFYTFGAFPGTQKRMQHYERHALQLARRALDELGLPTVKDRVTHLILTTCTGFYAPGLDLQIVEQYGLKGSVERTVVGFMGCNAAFNALKLARHIVLAQPQALVLVLNLELCTLHLKETQDLEQLLSFLVFADGCAASLVSAEPCGLALHSFRSTILPDSGGHITWRIGDAGFDMVLSGQIPAGIAAGLPPNLPAMLEGQELGDIRHWAVHPGGRIILDAVQKALGLPEAALAPSREVLRRFGNMSSATIMFVLKTLLEGHHASGSGCAMGFGPGVSIESMLFHLV